MCDKFQTLNDLNYLNRVIVNQKVLILEHDIFDIQIFFDPLRNSDQQSDQYLLCKGLDASLAQNFQHPVLAQRDDQKMIVPDLPRRRFQENLNLTREAVKLEVDFQLDNLCLVIVA